MTKTVILFPRDEFGRALDPTTGELLHPRNGKRRRRPAIIGPYSIIIHEPGEPGDEPKGKM